MEIFKNHKICLTPLSVSLRRVQLCALLANFGFSRIKISDSVQANTVPSPTKCSVSLLGVEFFANISILACLSGAQMGLIHEIKKRQNLVTLPL